MREIEEKEERRRENERHIIRKERRGGEGEKNDSSVRRALGNSRKLNKVEMRKKVGGER